MKKKTKVGNSVRNFSPCILLLIFFFSLSGKAAPKTRNLLLNLPSQSKPRIVLFEIQRAKQILSHLNQEPVHEPQELLPNRVYLYFHPKEKRWIWVMTDFEGNLPEPLEAFRTLSVIEGARLGATDPSQRYLLSEKDATWTPTFRPLQEFYWVYSDVPPETPKIKVVTYYTLGKRVPHAK